MSYNLERTLNCVLISRDIENEKTICLTQTSENKMNHCYMKWTVCIAGAKYKTSTNSQELCFYFSLSPVRLSIYGRKKDKLNAREPFLLVLLNMACLRISKWHRKGRQTTKNADLLMLSPQYPRIPKNQRIPKIKSSLLLTSKAKIL